MQSAYLLVFVAYLVYIIENTAHDHETVLISFELRITLPLY